MGYICYIMGKSSSGKDTIFRDLKKTFPNFKTIVPYTTRPIREGEQEGREYHFIEEAKLGMLERSGKVIEKRSYHTVHGLWQYATVDDGQVDLERYNYLVIGTLEAYGKLGQYYGAHRLIPLYIEVEDGLRLQRALARERQQAVPKYEEMCRRFLADSRDFSREKLAEAGITDIFVNQDKEECQRNLTAYIREKCGIL